MDCVTSSHRQCELHVDRWRHVENGALRSVPRRMSVPEIAGTCGIRQELLVVALLVLVLLVTVLGSGLRRLDQVVRVGRLALVHLEVVPVRRQCLVVEDEPRAERILPVDVVLENVHQPVEVVRKQLLAIGGLAEAEESEVLACRALPHAGHGFGAQNLAGLEADVRGLALGELRAERPVGEAHAVPLPLAPGVRGLEAVVAVILHVVLVADVGGLHLALGTDNLLEKHQRHILALARGVRLHRGGVAENVVGARGNDVGQLRLVLHAIQQPGGRDLLQKADTIQLQVDDEALDIDAIVDGDVRSTYLLHPEVGVLDGDLDPRHEVWLVQRVHIEEVHHLLHQLFVADPAHVLLAHDGQVHEMLDAILGVQALHLQILLHRQQHLGHLPVRVDDGVVRPGLVAVLVDVLHILIPYPDHVVLVPQRQQAVSDEPPEVRMLLHIEAYFPAECLHRLVGELRVLLDLRPWLIRRRRPHGKRQELGKVRI
mmetsp:Transcript_83790/g.240910  ORF Transcript_83790/g.240910 Transcript_83790/m.240910 type:complete len:486 (+) Transcript_83790:84-1541(+)